MAEQMIRRFVGNWIASTYLISEGKQPLASLSYRYLNGNSRWLILQDSIRVLTLLRTVISIFLILVHPNAFAFEERVEGTFGEWQLYCGKSAPSANEHCVLAQLVSAEENPNVNLGVIIVKRKELVNPILQVIAPINVLLSSGVNITIDQNKPIHFDFSRCVPPRCRAELVVDENILAELDSGKTADIVIYMSRDMGLRHLIRLGGFKDGYRSLR